MGNLSFLSKKTNFFYLSLILFVCSLPLSEFMVSASAGMMFLVALIEDNYSNKINRIKQRKLLLLVPSIFLIYLLSALITRNGETVLYDLRKALFFIVLPFAFLLGKEITSKQKQKVFIFFVSTVLIASLYAIINWKTGSNRNLSIHNASLITHIRFSFQLILAFWFLIFLEYKNFRNIKTRIKLIIGVCALGLIGFLFFQQSLTGIIAFVFSLAFIFIALIFLFKGFIRYILLAIVVVIIILPVVYIEHIAYPFYHPHQFKGSELLQKTRQGNSYHHDLNNLLIENGNYVYLFVCENELKEEWNRVSNIKYDSLDQFGYQVNETLVRYLTSKGVKKDAEGVRSLTQEDVRNIENGVSNYLLKKNRISLFPRIYITVWEFYGYTKLHQVDNQSFSQRLEFSKAAISIIKENFWIGVGTGNWKQAFYHAYKNMNSNLSENYYASSHNQYLNYLVKFGVIGFLLIMFFIIYPVIKTKRFRDPLFLIFLGFMFVANFADSNFESHMGSSFFVFFYCFFLVSGGIDYFTLDQKVYKERGVV